MRAIRILIALALALAMGAGAFAQETPDFGVKAGIAGNWMPGTFIDADDVVVPNFGFYGGAFVSQDFSDFFFGQVELLYSRKGVSTHKLVNTAVKYSRQIHYLQLPILVGMRFADERLSLMLGPEFGYCLGTKVYDGNAVLPDPSSMGNVRPFNFAIALQSCYWITENLGLDLKGDFGVTPTMKDAQVKDVKDRGHNLSIQIGLSYRFGY